MWTTYFLHGAFLVVMVLGSLVIVLVVAGLLFVLWQSHARSEVVLLVILLVWLS